MKVKEELESLIGIIESSMHEEGYITKRYSNTDGRFGTTSYDCLILRDENGKEYTLSIDERVKLNRENGNFEATNDLADEVNNIMKFYHFDGSVFGYFALIGAYTEEEAIKFYEEQVGDIEEKDITPDEITRDEAKGRLLDCSHSEEERIRYNAEFRKWSIQKEPYLVLIDSSLV
jgi:hypothetical protein